MICKGIREAEQCLIRVIRGVLESENASIVCCQLVLTVPSQISHAIMFHDSVAMCLNNIRNMFTHYIIP